MAKTDSAFNPITTTLMLRRIPRTVTPGALLMELQRYVQRGSIDFLYVPWIEGKGENIGRAFVNFTTPEAAAAVWLGMGKRGPTVSPFRRALEILPSYAQGLEANVATCLHRLELGHGAERDPWVFVEGRRVSFRAMATIMLQQGNARVAKCGGGVASMKRCDAVTTRGVASIRPPWSPLARTAASVPTAALPHRAFVAKVSRVHHDDVFERDAGDMLVQIHY
mmetsp:Transcript_104626/g.302763  ORF Transcript_104626/g.302763 Transcript_104626/m.302763 type:complete len:223 (+) Transcript_104626:114-782(+)